MAVSNIKALIPGELQKVWELVLNTENYAAWRSDLSKTEAISDKQFIEYTKNGYPTTFTVTLVKPYLLRHIQRLMRFCFCTATDR